MGKPGIHEAMEDEDVQFRAAIKQAAYEFESHGDPQVFQAHIAELMEGSKSRQRELFQKYDVTGAQRHPVLDQ